MSEFRDGAKVWSLFMKYNVLLNVSNPIQKVSGFEIIEKLLENTNYNL